MEASTGECRYRGLLIQTLKADADECRYRLRQIQRSVNTDEGRYRGG